MNATIIKICFIACLSATASIPSRAQEALKSTHSEDLPQTLLSIVQTYHVSVLGEISNTYPNAITLQIKKGQKIEDTLKALAAQCPGYTWYRRDGVVIFGDKKMLRAPGNPMNVRLRHYYFSGDLSEFKLFFPGRIEAAEEGIEEPGGVTSGPGLPPELSPRLGTIDLRDVTGRDVLVRVAAKVGNLYSVLLLPSADPTRAELENRAFLNWEIAGGPGMSTYRTYLHWANHR